MIAATMHGGGRCMLLLDSDEQFTKVIKGVDGVLKVQGVHDKRVTCVPDYQCSNCR